ncbi:MAG: helix-turn-helix domain-containing protein [Elainella sp. Prado103]|nr:helix-turn-helix domain-containing protein [Elainella sp. Prado103]
MGKPQIPEEPKIAIPSDSDRIAKERLAQLIKDLRGDSTQREFARRLGTSYTAVQDWEKQIRLPGEKNLKRIAEAQGWTLQKLRQHIFFPDGQVQGMETQDLLAQIVAQTGGLSPEQIEQLMNHLAAQLSAVRTKKEKLMRSCLNTKQKHNLHLLLRASLRAHSPRAAMLEHEVSPELFTDIFLRDDHSRVVTYADLENLSSLCCRVLRWQGEQLPKIDCTQTYLGQTDRLFNDLLAEGHRAEID